MALLGSFNPLAGLSLTVFRTAMVIGAIGTVLTAGYLLWMLQKVNLGEPAAEWTGKQWHDADRFELAAWIPLVSHSPSACSQDHLRRHRRRRGQPDSVGVEAECSTTTPWR
jgi:hypothetical protein